jgi:hypothetical protein
MFQSVPPPIIWSSKRYTQHRVFVELFLLLTAIVSELELQYQVFVELFLLLTAILSELEIQLTHDIGKKQKKLDKHPMLCIQF